MNDEIEFFLSERHTELSQLITEIEGMRIDVRRDETINSMSKIAEAEGYNIALTDIKALLEQRLKS